MAEETRRSLNRRSLFQRGVSQRVRGGLPIGKDLPLMRSSRSGWLTRPHRKDRPDLATIALNRLGFGPRPGDREAFLALGPDDSSRIEAYCEQQLFPDEIDDSASEQQLAASGFTTLDKSQDQLWAEHVVPSPEYSVRMQSIRETERAAFIRAVHSPCQLREVLADFWHNHFNVYAWDYQIGPNFGAYDRDVIRAKMFGNFREMLGAVASSSNMLFYLDNVVNSNAGPNENYARELFELHTLGAPNYVGVGRQRDVPLHGEGVPVGYVDDDIYEATRCFTGWSVNEDTGRLEYRNQWHDRFQKTVLGAWFPPDQPALRDGQDVLDLLAEHPGTADYIAWELCRRLISDNPDPEIVAQASLTFRQGRSAPDQLRQVIRTIVLSSHFSSTWGEKMKRTFALLVSFLRGTGTDLIMPFDDSFANSFFYLFEHTGHSPFAWQTPDGYPETSESWEGAQTFVANWRLMLWIVSRQIGDEDFLIPILEQTPGSLESSEELVDFWVDRLLGRTIDTNDRHELINFMAQGRNPTYPIGLHSEDVQDRLRSLVAVIGMSPEFLEA